MRLSSNNPRISYFQPGIKCSIPWKQCTQSYLGFSRILLTPLAPEGECSLLVLIGFSWCEVALAGFARLVGPDVNVWPRLDKIEDLPWKFGIRVEVPVSIRTACLKGGSTSPWVVGWSCFHQVGWRSEKPRRRERWRLREKRKKWTLVVRRRWEPRENRWYLKPAF